MTVPMIPLELALLKLTEVELSGTAAGTARVRDNAVAEGRHAAAEMWNEFLLLQLAVRDRMLAAQVEMDAAVIAAMTGDAKRYGDGVP